MSGDATRVHSKSGYQPLTSVTITDFRTYARNLGEGFGQLDYHYFILQLLYLVEYADYNSQSKLGQGYTNVGYTNPTNSGGCDYLGMKSGSIDGSDNSSIIYRGVEDIFGNIWQFVDGINIRNNQTYICYDQNRYVSDTFDGCYQPIGYVSDNPNTVSFISKLGYDSYNSLLAFPIETTGSDSTYISDGYVQNQGDVVAMMGGCYVDSVYSGLWNFNYYWTSSSVFGSVGSRLLKID